MSEYCKQHSVYDPTCPACQFGTKPNDASELAPSSGSDVPMLCIDTDWHPAMKSVVEWAGKLGVPNDAGEHDSLIRLMFQLDGRIRYLEGNSTKASHERERKIETDRSRCNRAR